METMTVNPMEGHFWVLAYDRMLPRVRFILAIFALRLGENIGGEYLKFLVLAAGASPLCNPAPDLGWF
jgi:hypothetical protein